MTAKAKERSFKVLKIGSSEPTSCKLFLRKKKSGMSQMAYKISPLLTPKPGRRKKIIQLFPKLSSKRLIQIFTSILSENFFLKILGNTLLYLLISQTKNGLLNIKKVAKPSKSCQAIKLRKEDYYNIYYNQATNAIASISSQKIKNNMREYHSSSYS